MPRTASCIFLSGLTLVASLLTALQRFELLGVCCLASGFAFGGFQGVVPAIASEVFGLQHFATNYAMIQLGPAAGNLHRSQIEPSPLMRITDMIFVSFLGNDSASQRR